MVFRKSLVHTGAPRGRSIALLSGGGGVPVITDPATEIADLYWWHDPSQEAYANGASATVLNDFSGLNKDFALAGNGCTMQTNVVNGHPVFRYPAGGFHYVNVGQPFAGKTEGEIFYVLKPTGPQCSIGGFGHVSWWGDDLVPRNDNLIVSSFGSNDIRGVTPSVQPDDGPFHIINFEARSGLWRCRMDGELIADLSANTVVFYTGQIRFGNVGAWDSAMCIGTAPKTDVERASIQNYLSSRFDIPLVA